MLVKKYKHFLLIINCAVILETLYLWAAACPPMAGVICNASTANTTFCGSISFNIFDNLNQSSSLNPLKVLLNVNDLQYGIPSSLITID